MRPQLLTAPEDWPTSNCIQKWFPSIFVTLRETRKLTYQHVKGDNFMLWQCLKKKLMKSILTWEWFAPLGLSEMDCKNLTSISYLERTFGSVKSSYMYQNFPFLKKNFASKEFLNSLWNLCDYFFLALDVGGGGIYKEFLMSLCKIYIPEESAKALLNVISVCDSEAEL